MPKWRGNALRYHHGPFRKICASGTNCDHECGDWNYNHGYDELGRLLHRREFAPRRVSSHCLRSGFTTEARKGISLTVGAQQVFNLTLQVGSAAKTVVEVTTEAPAVQLASSDISAVVTANTVRELPLNGRS